MGPLVDNSTSMPHARALAKKGSRRPRARSVEWALELWHPPSTAAASTTARGDSMLTTDRHTAVALMMVAGVALLLGGCSLLPHDDGPVRDTKGHITATVKADVTELVAGDCFTFQGHDRGSKPVTALPCARQHDFRVIQTGAATPAHIAKDGSLQNLMSVTCKKAFATFVATAKGDAKPELQFLVYSANDDDSNAKKDTRQHFSCIATEPQVAAAKG